MLYSTTCEYGIRALSYLARRPTGDLCLLDEIVEAEGLPRPFTSKILRDFVRAGILKSARGRHGGYALARDPESVSLLEIVSTIDGADFIEKCAVGLDLCDSDAPCPLHEVFQPIRTTIRTHMETTSLAELSAALKSKRAKIKK